MKDEEDMTTVIDAEHRHLAVRDEVEPAPPVALFGTSDPVAIIANATRVADALKAIVVKKKLVSNIQGKEYPQVEAWQTLAVMLGLAAICEWTRQVENGWEARVVVQRHGLTIAAAEAQCLRTEKTKKSWEDYAIRSMAQTRATSKSLRSVLGFVMVLAGYQPTPAEEMPTDTPAKPPEPRRGDDTAASRESGRKAVMAFATSHGISDAWRHEIAQAFCGAASTKDLDTAGLRRLYKWLTNLDKARAGEEWSADTFAAWLQYSVDEAAAE